MPDFLDTDKFRLTATMEARDLDADKWGWRVVFAFQVLLGIHVAGGGVALLTGPVSMLTRKGSPLHRRAGQVFASALGLASVSAFVLAVLVRDRLLLTIAVLTGFLIVSGVRAARFRRGARPGWMDDTACLLLGCFGAWLLWRSASPADATGLFFGAGGLVLAARQWLLLHAARPDWLLAHIAGMGGAYVATATAFMVVNLGFLPKPVVFIVPTVIGTALITWASVRHARRPMGERLIVVPNSATS